MVVCQQGTLVIGGGLFAQCASADHRRSDCRVYRRVAATVKEATDGAKLYIDAVNAKGGVNGRKSSTSCSTTSSIPSRCRQRPHADWRKGAVARVPHPGTPHNEQIIPVLDELKVPLVGPPHTPCCCTNRSVAMSSACARLISARGGKAVSLLGSIGITSIRGAACR